LKIPFVDLKTQYENHRQELDDAMAAVMADMAFIGNSGNPYVLAFENDFASFTGAAHTIGCANGTDALEILLKAAGIGPGDEVLVPALTWISTAESVSNVGGRPIFVDIDPVTYTLDPDLLGPALTERTRAIIPVHLYGLCADMDPIREFAIANDLFVLEDCAQAHGARYKGQLAGRMGNAGSFSFFPGKNLGAYGDAGGMITDDEDLAGRARMIGQHGQTSVKFQHLVEGRNSRLDGLQAAVLSVKLKYLEQWTEARIAAASRYSQWLAGVPVVLPACPENRRHVYHLYAIQVDDRDAVRSRLQEMGVASGLQYPVALPMLEAYADRGHRPGDFPVAEKMAAQVLTLPIYPELTEDQGRYVVDCLTRALG
jgi:dTDP-4-amino-4,6-dideoxygalactose transaminase